MVHDTTIQKILSVIGVSDLQKIYSAIMNQDSLQESEKYLLKIVVDSLVADPQSVNKIKPEYIEPLWNSISSLVSAQTGMVQAPYFTDIDTFVDFLKMFMLDDDIYSLNFAEFSKQHIDNLADIVQQAENKYGVRIDGDFVAYNSDKMCEVLCTLDDYITTNNLVDTDFADTAKLSMIKRSIADDSIFEGDSVDDKLKRLESMDDKSIQALYSINNSQWTDQYDPMMRAKLKAEVMENPHGRVSSILSPVSKEEMNRLEAQYKLPKDEADKMWADLEEKYGRTTSVTESYNPLIKKLLPVTESRRLFINGSTFNIVRGINEQYYVVCGKNLEIIKPIK